MVDALSDILALLRPQSFLTACIDAGGRWAMRSENHLGAIKCYAIMAGSCWLQVDGADGPFQLAAGDCFVLPSGSSFILASDLSVRPDDASEILGAAQPGDTIVYKGGGDTQLVGTRFDVDGRRAEVLLGTLPPLLLLSTTEAQATLRWSIEQMIVEMRGGETGASLAAHHLAHLMLLQAFRFYLAQRTAIGTGWLFALKEPQISIAIEAMHQRPAHRWTLDELARLAGLSRSVFARRFRERVGDTPIAYLTRWRMLLATERLTSTRDTLSQIAASLGYESENAFNTAFKRTMGSSPRRYAHGASTAAGAMKT